MTEFCLQYVSAFIASGLGYAMILGTASSDVLGQACGVVWLIAGFVLAMNAPTQGGK